MSSVAIAAEDITKVYHTGEIEVPALRGVTLAFNHGELMVLIGASGSGKSTLLNIVGGLDVPTSGSVTYQGQVLTVDALTQYRRDYVGFVFQFYNLIPSLTTLENVALVTEIAQAPMAPHEALERVGLASKLNSFPSQLSGGEQQRVAIARAVVKRPKILLCDEPTGALDFQTGVRVLEVIEDINRELGTTTVLITHNAPVASMAHRVITLADGQIQSDVRNDSIKPARDLRW